MEDIIVAPLVVGILFIGLPWLILHYMTKWKTGATLTREDENFLEELYDITRRLEDRMNTIERIIAAALRPQTISDFKSEISNLKSDSAIKLRTTVTAADEAHVREIVAATGMFRPPEVEVAAELVRIRLRDGAASGYEFVFAEQDEQVLGYACFGLNTVTVASYDLYWIAVRPNLQGRGIGQLLLRAVEARIAAAGGERIYIETSARPDYAATRGFYERCGYALEAVLRDFYASGDDKAVFVRRLG